MMMMMIFLKHASGGASGGWLCGAVKGLRTVRCGGFALGRRRADLAGRTGCPHLVCLHISTSACLECITHRRGALDIFHGDDLRARSSV